MKKTLAILLSAALLFTAIFVGMPLTVAAEDAIQATPLVFTGYNNNTIGESPTAAEVTPAWFTNAKGRKLTLYSAGNAFEVTGGMITNPKAMTFNVYNTLGTTGTHLMFYVEVDGPETIALWFTEQDQSYVFYLKNEGNVEVLAEGGTQWGTKAIVSSGDTSTGTYGAGAIKFDEAFKGVIKIPYNLIGTVDGAATLEPTMTVKQMLFCIKGLGVNKGYTDSVVIGPILNVTSDSTSTEIVVPDEFKISPIQATPWAISGLESNSEAITGAVTFTAADPLSFVNVRGEKATLKSGKDFYGVSADTSNNGRGNQGLVFTMDSAARLDAANEEYFLFRLETNGPVSISPQIRLTDNTNYNFWHTSTVKVLKDGSNKWEDKTTVNGNSAGNWSQIVFDEAFSGYIKIAYSDLCSGTMKSDNIKFVILYLAGMGTSGTNPTQATEITCGTFFTVSQDSTSTQIEVPDAYKPGAIQATPLAVKYNNVWTKNMDGTVTSPLDYSGAQGVKLTLGEHSAFASTGNIVANETGIRLELTQTYKPGLSETYLIFYVKTNGKATFYPRFYSYENYKNCFLKTGATVQVLADGTDKWESLATVSCSDSKSGDFGGSAIEFTNAFSGYIKVAYADMGMDGYTIATDGLRCVDFFVKGMGDDYATEITFGPLFRVTADSTSAEIELNSVAGDANVDGVAGDEKDFEAVRKSLLAETPNKYAKKYGNFNGSDDGEVDICDLVYLKKTIQPAAE